MYVMKWWNPRRVKYECKNTLNGQVHWHMMKWTMKWWNEQWNDETLEWLSKSVKHTKWPSPFAYVEMNIHQKGVRNYEEKMW